MCNILIFGGTTEGRILAEYCHEKKIHAWVSVVTGYGRAVLIESEYLHIHDTPMTAWEMEGFIIKNGIGLVLDATHPYAALASENIRFACCQTGVSLLRIVREPSEKQRMQAKGEGKVLRVGNLEEAVLALHLIPGNILVTTGSKELSSFTKLEFWEERVYARVLPAFSVITACEQMGFKGKHLIAMQGPFTAEMNRAMIRQYNINCLVTKEAGNVGGFQEKMEAAAECRITAVVIGRPGLEEGITVREAKKFLSGYEKENMGLTMPEVPSPLERKKVYLMGTGMGGEDQMTVKAWKELQQCSVVFGSQRILTGISLTNPHAVKIPFYASRDILPWLEDHEEHSRIGILYSGDTGFYSGAKNMVEALEKEPYCQRYDTVILPGITSVSYVCARLKTNWEDVSLLSLHGRKGDIIKELNLNPRVFVLLDGTNTVQSLCRLLKEQGFSKTRLFVGERLSYPDERITAGTPQELEGKEFDKLSVVLIERQGNI